MDTQQELERCGYTFYHDSAAYWWQLGEFFSDTFPTLDAAIEDAALDREENDE
jgi:hypothetical protein